VPGPNHSDAEAPLPTVAAPDLRRMVADLVLETACEGIWLIDAQARATFVNRAAAELLGYTEEEMIGRHIFDFLEEERRPLAQQNLMRRQPGVEERQEVSFRRKDGTFVWALGSANPVYDREGRYAGALALFGDLTRQKETERSLRAELADLRARAAASTPAQRTSLAREALRGVVAVAAGGVFVGAVGLLAVAGVVGGLLSSGAASTEY